MSGGVHIWGCFFRLGRLPRATCEHREGKRQKAGELQALEDCADTQAPEAFLPPTTDSVLRLRLGEVTGNLLHQGSLTRLPRTANCARERLRNRCNWRVMTYRLIVRGRREHCGSSGSLICLIWMRAGRIARTRTHSGHFPNVSTMSPSSLPFSELSPHQGEVRGFGVRACHWLVAADAQLAAFFRQRTIL